MCNNYEKNGIWFLFSFFTADIDPLYDMFADLTHKKFSPDLDTVLTQSYQLGEYWQSLGPCPDKSCLWGFRQIWDSNQSPQLQRIARISKFRL